MMFSLNCFVKIAQIFAGFVTPLVLLSGLFIAIKNLKIVKDNSFLSKKDERIKFYEKFIKFSSKGYEEFVADKSEDFSSPLNSSDDLSILWNIYFEWRSLIVEAKLYFPKETVEALEKYPCRSFRHRKAKDMAKAFFTEDGHFLPFKEVDEIFAPYILYKNE